MSNCGTDQQGKDPLQGKQGLVAFLFLTLGSVILLVASDPLLGCASPAAYAPTISRISASIWPQGYVYMMVAIVLMSNIFIEQVNVLASNRAAVMAARPPSECRATNWAMHIYVERIMRTGMQLALFTAIIPDLADSCDLAGEGDTCFVRILGVMHLAGIGSGMVVSVAMCVWRMRLALQLLPPSDDADAMRWRVLKVSNACVVAWACALLGMVVLPAALFDPPPASPPVQHICILHTTRAACEGQQVRERDPSVLKAGVLADWPCEWDALAPLQLPACTNPQCGEWLTVNRFSITCEFLALMFWVHIMAYTLTVTQDVEVERTYGDPFTVGRHAAPTVAEEEVLL